MGEKSKSSGELGEFYIENFLKLIGWTTNQSNKSIKCFEQDKHKHENAAGPRQTHGLDAIYSYESPLDTSTLIHSVISVKHNDVPYPNSPSNTFKSHVKDLAHTIECFANSDLIDENRQIASCENEQIVGVLFWLSSKSEGDYSVIAKLNPELPEELVYSRIHLIDNDRVTFIDKSIKLIQNKFKDYAFSFYYIDTPTNLADREKQYAGNKLPVEMLSSDIQVFRLQKDTEIILSIVVKDEFSLDGLKRIFGLAHRISSNFASKIYIFFPLFEHARQDNKNLVNQVKNSFREKELMDSIHVLGYDIDTFKDTEVPSLNTNAQRRIEQYVQPSLDDGKSLPYGEHLRTLLSRSIISEGELKSLLRKKGIYVCNPIKEQTIPILSSLLLSPREFDDLKEHQKRREDKEKIMTSQIKAEVMPQSKSLKKVLVNINLNDIALDKFSNYKFKAPRVNFQEIEKGNENKLILNYEIERYERNKAWDEQINYFRGAVIFDYNGDELNITSQSKFTSKETQVINKKIIEHCIEKLKVERVIQSTTKEEKILMKDMSNPEIIQFLLAFTNNKSFSDMKFIDITSLDIEIDETIDLPDDSTVKWMEKKIKKLKVDGKKIDDTELITNKSNHPYIKCWGMVLEYEISKPSGKIKTTVKLDFNKSHGNEFVVNIETKHFDKKLFNAKELDTLILSEIEKIKLKKYKEIIESRSLSL